MKSKNLGVLLSITCVLLLGGRAASGLQEVATAASPESIQDRLLHEVAPEVVLATDDVITVQVFQVKDFGFQQRIARDGSVQFPLIGKVHLAGKTVQEAENELASLLKTGGFLQDPQVSLGVVAQPSSLITVSGNVVKPSVIPAFGVRTIADCISEAGGLIEYTPSASVASSLGSKVVTLIRPSLKEPVTITLGSDLKNAKYGRIPVFAGDEIHVEKAGVVYAVGAFKTQGAFPLKSSVPTTVLQLAALAGGVGFEGDRGDAHLIRNEDGKRVIVDVDISAILKGKAADVDLQAEDILFVPTNMMKAAIKGGGSGLIVSMASAYLYYSR